MMSELITVGISDYKITQAPETLVTYALGSCIGTSLFDESKMIGGLSHIMLPENTKKQNATGSERMKYADTAIEDMLNELIRRGARRESIKAKIAGGANMFNFSENSILDTIGARNIEAVKNELKRLNIPLTGEDTGKNYGRTVYFDVGSGIMKIQSLGKIVNNL